MPISSVARRAFALLPLLALTSAPSLARAEEVLVFDSWDGGEDPSARSAGDSLGSLIVIAAPVTISNIAVRNHFIDPLNGLISIGGNLKFLVVDHNTHEVVYVSEPHFFPAQGMTWKKSGPLDVTLESGTYDIGAIADVAGWWEKDNFSTQSENYSSFNSNPNFSDYEAPYFRSHGGADGAVRLYVRIQECGDGIPDAPEECDDGNDDNTDDCLDTCIAPTCGDGYVWSGHEECDDENDDNTDDCLDTCVAATCGDGHVWSGHEECDDGNDDNSDDCPDTCMPARCGDGRVWSGHEECDDGNDDNTDLCLDTCVAATCGDGYVGPGEGCDDSNDVDGDGCTNACTLPTCGDGILQKGEECDDGNSKNDDGCTNACTLPTCGDKIVQ
jgi:cysteine-rich repeat protein